MPSLKSRQLELQSLLRSGFSALASGRIPEAAKYCERVLTLDPNLVQGHFLVALVATEAKDRRTAFQAFGSVTKLDPDHAAAWAHLARLCITDGQVNRADTALENALRTEPTDPVVQDLIGAVYSLMGEHGLAREWFEKAVAQKPNHVGFLMSLANNLVYHGETDEAERLHRRVIELRPDHAQAHWSLSSAVKAKDHTHIDELRSILASRKYSPRASAFFYYAMGKEFEDLGEWDEAFEAFAAGAAARRETVEYDEAAEIDMFETLEREYTPDWLGNAESSNDSDAPIFVLGQPRTGTTLIERIICAHPDVHSAGELQQFSLAIRRTAKFSDPKRFSAAFFEAALDVDAGRIGDMYLQTTKRMQGDTPHFVDKLPQNYLMIPLILKALPTAKIVHLTRNAADACFASYKQLFADAYLHSYDLEEMARHHCRYRHLMTVYRERFPGRFFDISYEETVHDLETNARALIDYLELPWDDACLRFHEQKDAVSTASAVQVREPAHTRSVDRWKRYEQQLEPMLVILRDAGYA